MELDPTLSTDEQITSLQTSLDSTEAERVRLEALVIEADAENKRLNLRIDALKLENLEKGETNARLNRDLQRARRAANLPDNS